MFLISFQKKSIKMCNNNRYWYTTSKYNKSNNKQKYPEHMIYFWYVKDINNKVNALMVSFCTDSIRSNRYDICNVYYEY